MDPLRLLTAECGFFTCQEAKGAGYGDRDIARMVRQRLWVRFRRGCYAFADEWSALDAVGKHRVRSRAVLRSHGDRVALSHVSGVIRHGIDPWGLPLDRVHVTRLDGGPGRIERDVIHHEGFTTESDITVIEGEPVLAADRCVVEAASRTNNEVALCLFDSSVRAGATSTDGLMERFRAMEHWPFVRHLHIPIRMADGRSGSVGESRGRWWFHWAGIPAPELQFEVRDAAGVLLGITDWWWEMFNLLGEFDGKVKYGRLLKPGQDPGEVVFQEKRREDQLREATGARMLRLIWVDYLAPQTIRERFDRLVGRAG